MNQDFEKRLLRQQKNVCKPLSPPSVSPFTNRQLPTPQSLPKSPKNLSPATPDRCGDRFIPSRAGARWHINFNVFSEKKHNCSFTKAPMLAHQEDSRDSTQAGDSKTSDNTVKDTSMYQCLLKNELLGAQIDSVSDENENIKDLLLTPKNLFKYSLKMRRVDRDDTSSPYSRSLLGSKSHTLLRSPRKSIRYIPTVPFKVLDAPDLKDDFYLNLLSWSSTNSLSVGLDSSIYLWRAESGETSELCDLSIDFDSVTSVQWNDKGDLLAIGTHKGCVEVWDVESRTRLVTMDGHSMRVSTLAWNGQQLSSGSRDRVILQRDIRSHSLSTPDRKLTGHRQEVCGLKWSPDFSHLASGGNDNKVMVWSAQASSNLQSSPMLSYSDHKAAVKALAWSPHQRGLLASGGGSSDRSIRFWNILSHQPLMKVDSGSQVCNLSWSQHSNELLSTHGYSENHITVWKYPSMTPLAKLTGHTSRVLYMATSPDNQTIVTGAGDETLRFWNVFSKSPENQNSTSALNLFTHIR